MGEKRSNNREAVKVLEKNGFKVIQFIEQDDKLFFEDLITFKADIIECIQVYQLLDKEGFAFHDCSLQISIVDGILEKPYGQIIFSRRL